VQLTAFVGRDRALSDLDQLLARSRLLTLTGPGGIGKTRLALEAVGRQVAANQASVAWVELAPHADPETLAMYVCLALGVTVAGGGSPEQALVASLREADALLVLDNCEHLVHACGELVHLLLTSCPQLRMLCTSREALGVAGERAWLVPALSLPGDDAMPDEALNSESARLFVDRARDLLPAFSLTADNAAGVARVCRRLDGLPLAIELAAARINVLTPTQIAERLDDRFGLLRSSARSSLSRHRTLHAAVEWSYLLLAGKERLLLDRLSVFAGGFTLDAAEQVCAGGAIAESEVLDTLATLVTRSLVAMQEEEGRARYRLLETIRDFALKHHQQRADADNTFRRHAEYMLAFLRRHEPAVLLGRIAETQRLDVEHENILVALAWSAQSRQGATIGLPICWSTMWYWFHRQRWRDGFRQFETALATADNPDPENRAAALHALGIFGLMSADPACRNRMVEAEHIWRSTGNKRWLGFTLLCRTVEASLRRDPAEARRLVDETMAIARDVGDVWQIALTIAHALAPVLAWEGQWDELQGRLIESENGYREVGYEIGISYVLDARAFVAAQLGDNRQAARLACESLRVMPHFENRWLAGRTLKTLGAVAFAIGQFDRATRLFGAAEAIHRGIGANPLTEERRDINAVPGKLRESMAPDDFDMAWRIGAGLSFEDAVTYALEMEELFPTDRGSAAPVVHAPQPDGSAFGPGGLPRLQTGVLEVSALGPLQVRRAGQLLGPEALRHARPRELLLYLLTHTAGRTREQIGLDFWPDASPSQVKNNFHVTLHHLRKAIGRDFIRYDRGLYLIDHRKEILFDADIFEARVGDALASLRRPGTSSGARAAAVNLLTETIELYRGPFMASEPAGDWHIPVREHLYRLYTEGVEALALHHESSGQNSRAADLLLRILSTDSTREDCARRLMLALAKDGRRSDALRVFERLEKELSLELGVSPERESRQLAESIRRGDLPGNDSRAGLP